MEMCRRVSGNKAAVVAGRLQRFVLVDDENRALAIQTAILRNGLMK